MKRCEETGSIAGQIKSDRPRSGCCRENIAAVIQTIKSAIFSDIIQSSTDVFFESLQNSFTI